MSSRHTSRYGLSQWEKTDKILMEDFNSDNLNIERALRNHDSQLLGVPTLGRNLYNLFLHQKKAGQDVSWMQGLVYDDFSDQSKIASMGEGMTYSTAERCIHFTPVNEDASSILITAPEKIDLNYNCAFAWLRYSLAQPPVVEFRSSSQGEWTKFDVFKSSYWTVNLAGEQCAETTYFLPSEVRYTEHFQMRITLKTFNDPSILPERFYDFGCMLMR